MPDDAEARWGYIAAGIVGMLAGGLIVALATRAVTKVASRMPSDMMCGLAQKMRDEGCEPGKL